MSDIPGYDRWKTRSDLDEFDPDEHDDLLWWTCPNCGASGATDQEHMSCEQCGWEEETEPTDPDD